MTGLTPDKLYTQTKMRKKMNDQQTNKLNQLTTVKTFLQKNSTITPLIPAFANVITEFDIKINEIVELDALRESIKAGKTANKLKEEQELVDSLFTLMSALKVYATITGNNEILAETDYSEYELRDRMRDMELLEKGYGIYNLAKELITPLADYGVTEGEIEIVKTNADEFTEAIGNTGTSNAVSKTKTASLKTLFSEADAILYNKIDSLVDILKTKQLNFWNEYQNARIIVDR